jgi:hypothetical protein
MTIRSDDIKKLTDENEVRARITQWIENTGGEVFWGECPNNYSQQTFSVNAQSGLSAFSGTTQSDESYRPDMLLVFDDYCAVVEVKPGNKYGHTMDGAWETFDYWRKYEQDSPEYIANGEAYNPDSFLLATRYSPFGHLFPDTDEFLYENEYGPVNQTLPKYEGNMTGLLVRLMWRFGREFEEPTVGIGLLLSSVLEDINRQQADLDSHNMMRASTLAAAGGPAVFHRVSGTQDWEVL